MSSLSSQPVNEKTASRQQTRHKRCVFICLCMNDKTRTKIWILIYNRYIITPPRLFYAILTNDLRALCELGIRNGHATVTALQSGCENFCRLPGELHAWRSVPSLEHCPEFSEPSLVYAFFFFRSFFLASSRPMVLPVAGRLFYAFTKYLSFRVLSLAFQAMESRDAPNLFRPCFEPVPSALRACSGRAPNLWRPCPELRAH